MGSAEVARNIVGIIGKCYLLFLICIANRSTLVGILCVVFGGLMYASPLTVMRKVIKTRSVKYMPFYLSLANFLNGVIWVGYALIRVDLYILIGNGFGAVFGTIHLILYACHFKSTPRDDGLGDGKLTAELQLPTHNGKTRP